jgi:hypothetical protein
MRRLKFYLWLLNRSKGTELHLTWVDEQHLVIGRMHELTEVKLMSKNQLVIIESLRRLDKLAKAHYELQMWNGAQAIEKLKELGVPEDIAVEVIHQCILSGRDPMMLVKYPEAVLASVQKLQELMPRG